VALVKESLAASHPSAKVSVTIGGYFNGTALKLSETELEEALKTIETASGIKILNEARDVKRILDDDLFKTFREKLRERSFTDEKNTALCQLAINAMTKAGL
jgi:hypothetical protein